MKIAFYGATGTIGRRIAQEALDRGHHVTAISRNAASFDLKHPNLKVEPGDARDPAHVAQAVAGHDVVITAISPRGEPGKLVEVARALIEGVGRSGVRRLLVVGGAGSLEIAPGKRLVDSPEFPPFLKPIALAHVDAFEIYRQAPLDWTYFSPPSRIEPGTRTGKYRLGTDQLVTDAQGTSRISAEDYAVALIDELEKPQFLRRRFTAAY